MKNKILFVCPHGGAKSVIAQEYFNQLVGDLPFQAVAAAGEDPYEAVPAPVAERLASEGFDVSDFTPRAVAEEELQTAARVIGIGCPIAKEQWSDVPMASEDLDGCVAAIRRHVEELVDELR